MKPEARCAGVPVLLDKLTTEVTVSLETRGEPATKAAKARDRREYMTKNHSESRPELLDFKGTVL